MTENDDDIQGHATDSDDDILSMGDDELDELGEGLALGDSQAEEIKSIFLTTLPQYLEPVAEMVDQLLTTTESDCSEALTATLLSLSTAAARIGVEEVQVRLDHMHAAITQVEDPQSPFPVTVHTQLVGYLDEIRVISNGEGSSVSQERSQTILSALQESGEVDDAVLAKLSAAGVVTVEQLKMAQVHEIVAVSGLETSVVEGLLRALGQEARPSTGRQRQPLGGDGENPDNTNVVELQLEETTLRAQFESKLRNQIELETAVGEIRADVQHKRNNNISLRTQWDTATQHKAQLEEALAAAQDDLRQRLAVLGELPRVQEQMTRKYRDACQTTEEMEQRILDLRSHREQLRAEEDQFAQELGKLGRRVARMLELMAEK